MGAELIGWLVCLGLVCGSAALRHDGSLRRSALLCIAALGIASPAARARRWGNAANALYAAVTMYEGSKDRPESALTEADRRAREMLRVARIRTAPRWIVDKRRRYGVRILGWKSQQWFVALLVFAWLLFPGPWLPPLHLLGLAAASQMLDLAAMSRIQKLVTARGILRDAIERYEFESAETEATLDEAGRRASAILPG